MRCLRGRPSSALQARNSANKKAFSASFKSSSSTAATRGSFFSTIAAEAPAATTATMASAAASARGASTAVDRPVGYWLLGTAGMVAGMVSIGGLTRLTKSGLSMAYWKPTRVMPPVTPEEWAVEFENYKQFPEWQQRQSMTLDEFKFIFYWEYGHRMLGRAVGVAFGAPLAYFLARGRIPAHLKGRMFTLFALGGSQGAIGWWMVKSGVDTSEGWVDPNQRKEIRVSPYRLATHLVSEV
jgi:cytochrome c oxidase assembly protein subunit 15